MKKKETKVCIKCGDELFKAPDLPAVYICMNLECERQGLLQRIMEVREVINKTGGDDNGKSK